MDNSDEKIPPAGLHPRLVRRLLDKLESDDAFRKTFVESPEQALRSIGYTDPWACMQGCTALASPDQIKANRSKLEDSLVSVQKQLCEFDSQQAI